jgi:hypothetical protein
LHSLEEMKFPVTLLVFILLGQCGLLFSISLPQGSSIQKLLGNILPCNMFDLVYLFTLGAFKGGAKKRIQTTKPKSKKIVDDYDEADEDEENEDDYYEEPKKRRSGRSQKRWPSKAKKQSGWSLIPWKTQSTKASKKKSGPSFRDTLDSFMKTGQSAYKEVYRRAKVLKSSPFEGMLLKATWPSNDAVPPEILTDIIKYSIPAFKFAQV